MAKQSEIFLTVATRNIPTVFEDSDGTTAKEIAEAGADDSLVTELVAISTAADSYVLSIFLRQDVVNYLLGNITLPSNTRVDLLTLAGLKKDASGNAFMALGAGNSLQASLDDSLDASEEITILATLEDF